MLTTTSPKPDKMPSPKAKIDDSSPSLDDLHRTIVEQLARAKTSQASGDTHAAANAAQIVLLKLEEYSQLANDKLFEVGL